MMERIKAAVRAHREFVLVLVLAVAFRAMAVLAFKLGGYLGEISDFMFFRILADFANQGFYPLVHYWLEYPPVFPWLMVGVYRLSLLIPAWTTPGTWFYLLLGWVFVAVEAGNLVAVYALALRLHGREQGVRVAWIYSALIIPVFVLLGWFDALPLLFLLLAVLWSLDRRPAAAGLAAGIGFMTKVTPVVALPAAWLYLKGRSARARLALAALLAVGLIAAPFLAVGPEHLIAALTNSGVRSPWETVWALIDGYYSFGIAGGWDRFDPAQAGAAQPAPPPRPDSVAARHRRVRPALSVPGHPARRLARATPGRGICRADAEPAAALFAGVQPAIPGDAAAVCAAADPGLAGRGLCAAAQRP